MTRAKKAEMQDSEQIPRNGSGEEVAGKKLKTGPSMVSFRSGHKREGFCREKHVVISAATS